MIFQLQTLLLTQTAAAWFMCGLIWFVQVVHYPLMNKVGQDHWTRYEQLHQRQTTWVVAPVMLIEALSCAGVLINMLTRGSGVDPEFSMIVWISSGLLLIVWGSTFALQVPAHQQLTKHFDTRTHRKLVNTNWVRTIAWTMRSVLLTYLSVA